MPELAAHLERVAKLTQQLEDRAIQRVHPPEGEVSVGDELWECVLCGVESATKQVKHDVDCPILGVAATLAACAREEQLEEARRIYTNWNVADRDFEKWLKAHIGAQERAVGEKP